MKDIKIFVSHRTDKISQIINNSLYVNMSCGAALVDNVDLLQFPGDNTGDNISLKKEHFSELSVMYWAWKNVDADYYGLCHYRRYFAFPKEENLQYISEYIDKDIYPKGQGFIVYPHITPRAIELFGLDEKSMRAEIENTDVILRKPIDVRELDNLGYTCAMHGREKNKPSHNIDDVHKLIQIIHEKYPEYDQIVKNYYNGPYGQWFDCFIMKKEIFFPFCQWLFDILFELEKRIDYSKYNYQMIRATAYLSEDLFGIYFKKAALDKAFKITYKPLVLFQNTDKYVAPECKQDTVVVISCNEFSSLQASVTINSIAESAGDLKTYSIIVIGHNLSRESVSLLKLYSNSRISVNIISPYELFYGFGYLDSDNGFSEEIIERYVQLFLPYLMTNHEKAVYVKAGSVVQKDISNLYETNIEMYAMGAVKDIILAGYVNGANEDVRAYYEKHHYSLDPYNQFDIDIMILNLKKMREAFSLQTLIQYIRQDMFPNPKEFINHLYKDRIHVLDSRWNTFTINGDMGWAIELTPYEYWKLYQNSKADPYIINYACPVKPWESINTDMSGVFWKYARNSHGYEQLLVNMSSMRVNKDNVVTNKKSVAKKVRNVILPYGTRRRNVVYNIYKKLKK